MKKTNRNGYRHFALAGMALAASTLVPQPVRSQAAAELERCAQIERDRRRLACYDALLRTEQTDATAATETAERISGDVSAPTAAAQTSDRAAAPATASATQRGSDRASDAERTASESDPNRDQRRGRRQRDREAIDVVIVDVSVNFTGLAAFTTEDGDVYIQTSTDNARYGEPPFTATLEPGSFGSFFLSPNDDNSRIRVSLRD